MTQPINPRTGAPITPESLNDGGKGRPPGLIGMEIPGLGHESVSARLDIRPDHLAPNGFLHAATVITLADTACGYGALAFRAEGANGFTTIEIKSNFVGTVLKGAIACTARKVH